MNGKVKRGKADRAAHKEKLHRRFMHGWRIFFSKKQRKLMGDR
jgi:hypothetical protein